MKKVTSYDVAERAGVSRATVSLVLSGSTGVTISPDTKRRVKEAAEFLKYQPNRAGRMLVRGKSETLGIVVTDPILLAVDGFIAQLLQAIIEKSGEDGYRVIVDSIPAGGKRTYRDLVREGAIDGLLVISPRAGDADLGAIIESGFPVSLVGSVGHPDEISVALPTRQAIQDLVDHLAGLGHRRIGYVSFAPPGMVATDVRVEAYRSALARNGLPIDPAMIVYAGYSAASGRDATDILLDLKEGAPTAIMAGNDTIAIGVLSSIAARGLRVPEDISVVGFDDLPIAAFLIPPLTTVRHDAVLRARVAVEALIRTVRGLAVEERRSQVPAELVVRRSTGPAKGEA